ncbi:MAG: discoidin domain-containing protein [Pedobacter sp.]|uniref:discoidin domain-containing protein n=1 Tax=Pedobacter sp. TaxID=1411316 RepID=UPI003564A5E2
MKVLFSSFLIAAGICLATPSIAQQLNILPVITTEFPSSNPNEDATKLNDKNTKTKYFNEQYKGQWFQYEFEKPIVYSQYIIGSANDVPKRDPKNWILQGSTDGKKWVDLDTKSEESFPERQMSKTYAFENKIAYKHYRLKVTETAGGPLQLSEWNLLSGK